MRKLVIFVVSLVVIMSTLSVPVFAAQSQVPVAPPFEATLKNVSVEPYNSSVMAGSTFDVTCSFDIPDSSNYNGTATASVSGTGFTMNGYFAEQSDLNNSVVSDANYKSRFRILVDSSLEAGRYPVTLTIHYTNTKDETVTFTQVLNINVSNYSLPTVPEDIEPTVTLNVTSTPESAIPAGETFGIGFTSFINNVYNYGYGFGYNYGYTQGTVTVSGNGFTLAGALAEQQISSGSAKVSVLADSTLATGRYPVTLTVTYQVNGKDYTDSAVLNIDVTGKDEDVGDEDSKNVSFKLTKASIPEKRGRSNLSTTLNLEFTNATDYPAENVKIKLTGLSNIILNTYTDTVDGGVVNGGQTVSVSFPIKFPEFPTAQTTLTVELSYDTDAGPKTEPFNVYLQATENKQEQETPESAALTPKVIVSSYGVDVDTVTSGAEFTFSFVLKNTSTEKDLKNMTVNVTPEAYTSGTGSASSGPVFSFIDGTSSFYTDVLEKDSELEYSIRLKCSASAGAGSYPIKISFNFEYANNGGYSASSGDMDINLPVSQPIKFELLEWIAPTECPQSGVPLSFQYYNKSRNPMTSLVISAEGDFEMPVQTIGTLAASSYDFFNGTVTPSANLSVGDTGTCTLVFTFEDAAGEEQRIEESFEMTVTEGSADGMMGGPDGMGGFGGMGGDITIDYGVVDPGFNPDGTVPADGDAVDGENAGLPLWAKIAIPAGAAVIVIIIVAVVVKKVKAKRELEDDDD